MMIPRALAEHLSDILFKLVLMALAFCRGRAAAARRLRHRRACAARSQ